MYIRTLVVYYPKNITNVTIIFTLIDEPSHSKVHSLSHPTSKIQHSHMHIFTHQISTIIPEHLTSPNAVNSIQLERCFEFTDPTRHLFPLPSCHFLFPLYNFQMRATSKPEPPAVESDQPNPISIYSNIDLHYNTNPNPNLDPNPRTTH